MKMMFAALASVAVLTATPAGAAVIAWEATKLTGPSDVSTNGVLLEALNFSGGANPDSYDTEINGVTFEGFTNGVDAVAADDQDFVDPTATIYSSNSTRVTPTDNDQYDTADGGLAAFDELLSRRLQGPSGNDVVTLMGLDVGQLYEVQLFMGGTGIGDNRYIVIDDGTANEFGSATLTNLGDSGVSHSNEPDPNAPGIVITGTFLADSSTQSFSIVNYQPSGSNADRIPNQAFFLNGYQVRAVPEPATWCLGFGFAALAFSRRVFKKN